MLFFKCHRALTVGFALSLLALGCGGDEAEGDDHGDHGGHDAQVDPDEDAPCTDDYPPFGPDTKTQAGPLTVRLLSIDPRPPRQKMDNSWVLEVVDAAGAPVPGAVIEGADTWMDVHRHGGRWNPTIEALPEAGRYELTRIDFKMPGPWSLRFDVRESEGGAPQRAVFKICVE